MGVLKVETAFRALLLADATVSAGIGTRLHPCFATQLKDFPLCTYRRINTAPEHNMEGVCNFVKARVELMWWGPSYDALCTLAAAAEAALVPTEGVASVTVGADSSTFDYLHLVNYSEDAVEIADGSGKMLFRLTQEYEVGYIPLGSD